MVPYVNDPEVKITFREDGIRLYSSRCVPMCIVPITYKVTEVVQKPSSSQSCGKDIHMVRQPIHSDLQSKLIGPPPNFRHGYLQDPLPVIFRGYSPRLQVG